MQSIESVELRRNTSSPFGRSSRAASGMHLYGSHQIDAPYSEMARSNAAPGRPVASAFASTSSRPSLYLMFSRRAVSSWAAVMSTPTTRRAPRRFSQAATYAVPQPSSTTSLPRRSGRTPSLLSGVFQAPGDLRLVPLTLGAPIRVRGVVLRPVVAVGLDVIGKVGAAHAGGAISE